ncbi:hypothetical protein ONZ45_g17315 [Pleurotus djamor]|nr:hypothetical protein ONZ45_g17315 [Pleurotus djamor]
MAYHSPRAWNNYQDPANHYYADNHHHQQQIPQSHHHQPQHQPTPLASHHHHHQHQQQHPYQPYPQQYQQYVPRVCYNPAADMAAATYPQSPPESYTTAPSPYFLQTSSSSPQIPQQSPILNRPEDHQPQTNIMLGYHNRPDANAEAFDEDGYMRTGDVVRVDKDGHFFIVDRVKEIIKYNGYQVPPAELEDILISHDEVADAAVIGLADPSTGTEYPAAFVVLKPTSESNDQQGLQRLRETLLQYVSGQVAHYKCLRGGITFVDSIPKSPSGKILRKRLRELMLHHQAQVLQRHPHRKILPSPS